MSDTFKDVSTMPEREPVPGYHGRFVHTDSMTLAFWRVDAGAAIPEHAHPQEQVASVLEGEFELIVAGEARIMGPGSVAIIRSNVPHSGRAVTECRLVDVWHPARDDYR